MEFGYEICELDWEIGNWEIGQGMEWNYGGYGHDGNWAKLRLTLVGILFLLQVFLFSNSWGIWTYLQLGCIFALTDTFLLSIYPSI